MINFKELDNSDMVVQPDHYTEKDEKITSECIKRHKLRQRKLKAKSRKTA